MVELGCPWKAFAVKILNYLCSTESQVQVSVYFEKVWQLSKIKTNSMFKCHSVTLTCKQKTPKTLPEKPSRELFLVLKYFCNNDEIRIAAGKMQEKHRYSVKSLRAQGRVDSSLDFLFATFLFIFYKMRSRISYLGTKVSFSDSKAPEVVS